MTAVRHAFVPVDLAARVARKQRQIELADHGVVFRDGAGPWLESFDMATFGVLAKWDAALYDDRLLRAESRRLAFAVATTTDDPAVDYGFGWRVTGESLWHSGETIGFRNVIVRYPRRRLTIVILTNRDEGEPYRTALAIAGFALGEAPRPLAGTPEPDAGGGNTFPRERDYVQ